MGQLIAYHLFRGTLSRYCLLVVFIRKYVVQYEEVMCSAAGNVYFQHDVVGTIKCYMKSLCVISCAGERAEGTPVGHHGPA